MVHLNKSTWLAGVAVALMAICLQSCGGSRKYLVVPHSVSTISAVPMADLNLKTGDYDVLKTVSETASVVCEYRKDEIKVVSGDGDFSYTFKNDIKNGWSLKSFSGAAEFGYFSSDFEGKPSEVPNIEEFSRRVAMARIVTLARDYGADAVLEPVCVTRASNAGNRKVEYSCTVSAKLIVIKVKK